MVATHDPAPIPASASIPAGSPTRRANPWPARVVLTLCLLVTIASSVLAFGIVAGRVRVWAVTRTAPDVRLSSGALAFLEPTTFGQLHQGDLVVTQERNTAHPTVYRVDALVSSVDKTIEVRDERNQPKWLQLGHGEVWRVTHRVPAIGGPIGSLPGSITGWLLLVAGAGLLCFARAREWVRQRRRSA